MVLSAHILVPSPTQVKAALATIFNALSGPAKESVKKRLKEWQTQAKLNELYKKTKYIRQVKTIWQLEKEVDIYEFYCPSFIIMDGKRFQVNDIEDFPYQRNILIEGTVGQGKSILFRFLASQELILGRTIPAFVELRKLSKKDNSLMQHIYRAYSALGLEIDKDIFDYLANNCKTTIFLDAFDEVGEAEKSSLIEEIEQLAVKYEHLKIFVSSRPDSGIAVSSFFRIGKLSPLEEDDYKLVIRRFCPIETMANEIISRIERNLHVQELLTTPLMIALLVFRYKIDQTLPDNIAAFYTNLFELLLLRHDKTKPGFIRERKSQLGDFALSEIFEAVCYLTRKQNKGHFTARELVRIINDAATATRHTCDSEKVLTDFVSITCLILREGGECRFLHKSVQEFYASAFIKSRPDRQAQKFYSEVQTKWDDWSQELDFLSTIDRYRYKKYFLIDSLRLALTGRIDGDPATNDYESMLRILYTDTYLNFRLDGVENGIKSLKIYSFSYPSRRAYAANRYSCPDFMFADQKYRLELSKAYHNNRIPGKRLSENQDSRAAFTIRFSVLDLAAWNIDIKKGLFAIIKDMVGYLDKSITDIRQTESVERLFSL